MSDLDPKIAVYSNKLENLLNQKQEREKKLQDNKDQINNLNAKLSTINHSGEISSQKKS